jgi:hypothetical protein
MKQILQQLENSDAIQKAVKTILQQLDADIYAVEEFLMMPYWLKW